ncbi:MAG: DUF885 family protein, partial [Candidatus Krumholzibacteriia bacterium]
AEQLMVEAGWGGPEFRLNQDKMRLRTIANAILDNRIHTAGMTEDEAMRLMMEGTFQQEGEAAGKWRRACLTSTQLSTYYVGNLEVNAIRRDWEERAGRKYRHLAFHDELLSHGSPPPRLLRELMGLRPADRIAAVTGAREPGLAAARTDAATGTAAAGRPEAAPGRRTAP